MLTIHLIRICVLYHIVKQFNYPFQGPQLIIIQEG